MMPARPHRSSRFLSPILIAAFFIPLVCAIWGKTGEIVPDFGDDLYDAWRLSQGKVLFRDVAVAFGPLSPEINGLVMRFAGPQVTSILVFNLILLIITTLLLYHLLRVVSGLFTAVAATIFFLCVFALASPTNFANYNYLTPYRAQMTHGFLLTLAAIACLYRYQRRNSKIALILGSFFTGLTFLTKPELFLGAAAAYASGLAAILWLNRGKNFLRTLILSLAAAVLPPLAFLICYSAQMPFRAALQGVLSGWPFVGNRSIVSLPYYRGDLGTDHPLQNSILMFQYAAFYLAVAATLIVCAIAASKLLKQSRAAAIILGIVVAIALFFLVTAIGNHLNSFWSDVARGFPLFSVFAVVYSAVLILKSRTDPPGQSAAILLWTLSILSCAYLIKMPLNARMYHYGFVLAVPGAVLMIVAFTHWLPNWASRVGCSPDLIRLGALGIFAACAYENILLTQQNLSQRTLPVPLALGGTAWCRPVDAASIDAIKWLSTTPPNITAAVIPDAAGINYAAARITPIPVTEMNPLELSMFGEKSVLNSLIQNPPDYILLMEMDDSSLGARTFGRDYALQLSGWIKQHYSYIARFPTGTHPIQLWKLQTPIH